jgi:hypothetical protein
MLGSLLLSSGRRRSFPFHDPAETFRPTEIAGLTYWFDARDAATLYQDNALSTPVTADGQTVGGWKDKANANHLAQATGTARPAYKASYINGRPAVEADGVDDFLRATGLSVPQPMTIYVVAKLATSGANLCWFDGAGTATERVRLFTNAGSSRFLNAGLSLVDGLADTNPHVHSCLFNGATSEYYVDGTLAAGPGDAGAQLVVGLTLFASRTGTNVLPGGIGEFLLYTGAHSSGQRRQVEAYLKQRWGL